MYIDAIYIPVRRDTVENEAFYTVMELKKDLRRDIIGVYNIPQESASGWQEIFKKFKKRVLRPKLFETV